MSSQLKAWGGRSRLQDWITISRKGAMAKVSHGMKGEKRIPIASVTAVQFKKPGLANGYIQFSIGGGSESKGGVLDATKDENTVMFTSKHHDEFRAVRDEVERIISQRQPGGGAPTVVNAAAPSVGSQLKELAELRDAGVLSEEEFQAQKAKLLA